MGRASGLDRDPIESCNYAPSKGHEAHANSQSPVDFLHLRFRQSAELLYQPSLVDRPNLIQKHYGIHSETCPWVLPPSSVATPCLNASVSWPACVGERH